MYIPITAILYQSLDWHPQSTTTSPDISHHVFFLRLTVEGIFKEFLLDLKSRTSDVLTGTNLKKKMKEWKMEKNVNKSDSVAAVLQNWCSKCLWAIRSYFKNSLKQFNSLVSRSRSEWSWLHGLEHFTVLISEKWSVARWVSASLHTSIPLYGEASMVFWVG